MIDQPACVHKAKSYSRIHGLLIERRGSASDFTCACGSQADQWAYRHGSPDELVRTDGVPYSTNLADYDPMCYSCHYERDVPHKAQTAGDANRKHWQNPEFRKAGLERLSKARANRKGLKPSRRCSCGREMTAPNLGRHQKRSGHVGWESIS